MPIGVGRRACGEAQGDLDGGIAVRVRHRHHGRLLALGVVAVAVLGGGDGEEAVGGLGRFLEGVDPVGTFVGGRGSRVQAVMNEIGEEKIDIIAFNEDPKEYIAAALSPTKVISVKLNEEEKKAVVKVPEDQLSLAIGKAGQNVRLAAKLTGWNVDIDGADDSGIEETAKAVEDEPKTIKTKDLEESLISEVQESDKEPEITPVADTEEKTAKIDDTKEAKTEDDQETKTE